MSTSSLASMDSFLYHRYLKGESLYSNAYASTADSMSSPVESDDYPMSGAYCWDLQETCKPLFPALDYISSKLSQEGLSIHLIVSNQCPFVIPVWELPPKSQVALCKLFRKACRKFDLAPSWMTVLASLAKADLPQVFNAYRADAYVVRRSVLQKEIVYSSNGLTILTIDHLFTLKQLLCTLSKQQRKCSLREYCLASCVHILHRIHKIYTGKPASAAYLERVYKETPFQDDAFEEVVTEYNARYCTASIYDLSFQPEYFSVHLEDKAGAPPKAAQEPPDSGVSLNDRNIDVSDELVSPLDRGLDLVRTWETQSLGNPNPDYALPGPISVSYPSIQAPTSSRSSSSNSSTNSSPNSNKPTPPSISPSATSSQLTFPPPLVPPPSYPLPPLPTSAHQQRTQQHNHHRSMPSASNSLPISSISSDQADEVEEKEDGIPHQNPTALLPPSPLKITKGASQLTTSASHYFRTFPPPPRLRDSTPFPLLAPSAFTDGNDNDNAMEEAESAVDGEFLWELHVLESPSSHIESWSRRTEGALCRTCHAAVEG